MAGEAERSGSLKSHDKRDNVRRLRRIMVRYGTRIADKTAFTKNISETGVFIQTNNVLKPGSTIQIKLTFPDREFSMWARVRWARKAPPQLAGIVSAGMGIQFIDSEEDWSEYFRTHVAG